MMRINRRSIESMFSYSNKCRWLRHDEWEITKEKKKKKEISRNILHQLMSLSAIFMSCTFSRFLFSFFIRIYLYTSDIIGRRERERERAHTHLSFDFSLSLFLSILLIFRFVNINLSFSPSEMICVWNINVFYTFISSPFDADYRTEQIFFSPLLLIIKITCRQQ